MVLWRCQHLHWNRYYRYPPFKNIQFPDFYCWISNNNLDHWEDNVYLQDLFLSNWFLFSTFSWGNIYNENPKIFLVLCPKPHQGSALDLLGGSQHSPNPQLIIVIAARSFSQNSKKTDQLIFPCFDHCISPEP